MKLIVFVSTLIFAMQCSNKEEQAPDYSLNDIWVLEELADFTSSIEGLKGKPTLEIHLSDSTYLGHSGCNNYQGKVELAEGVIKFLPAVSTRMFCDDEGLEQAFFVALHEANAFEVKEMQLLLSNSEGLKARFKKVD